MLHKSICPAGRTGRALLPSRRLLLTLGAALSLAAMQAHAQSRFEEDFEDQEKPWQEVAVQLPGPPQAANLIPLYVSATATQEFAIDLASVTLGQDGVIRYTAVAVGSGGARNVSYEGIRCATYERKLYAFGQPDGSWTRSRRDRWERIAGGVTNQYHAVLAQEYFCDNLSVAGSERAILDRLASKQRVNAQKYR